jgi:carbonic anhydrase
MWGAFMTQDTIVHPATCACCGDMLRTRFDRRRFLHLTAGAGLLAAFPSLAFGAEGNYDAMLLTCIDPRFPEPTINYMKSRNMVGKYSQFTFAGAAIGVVAPAFKDWSKAFWDNLAASIQLHHIPKVIAMNHRDCGAAKIAYGAEKVATAQIETETHKAVLMEFRKQVAERQPKLAVETGLMALDGKVEMFS